MTTSLTFRKIFQQLNIRAAELEGDSFHYFTRPEIDLAIRKARNLGRHVSYFRMRITLIFWKERFITMGKADAGRRANICIPTTKQFLIIRSPTPLSPGSPLPELTDVLFYKGLHGGVVTEHNDIARYVDLLVVVPIVNLEWIQKLVRDTNERQAGYSCEAVMDSMVQSMENYINFTTPQFSRTHINFQRVPKMDFNPFAAKAISSLDESFVVIHFRGLDAMDFPY